MLGIVTFKIQCLICEDIPRIGPYDRCIHSTGRSERSHAMCEIRSSDQCSDEGVRLRKFARFVFSLLSHGGPEESI